MLRPSGPVRAAVLTQPLARERPVKIAAAQSTHTRARARRPGARSELRRDLPRHQVQVVEVVQVQHLQVHALDSLVA